MKGAAENVTEEIEYFFTKELMVEKIVDETNKYAAQILTVHDTANFQKKGHKWKNTDAAELWTFSGHIEK